jgi:PAS domain S-box-containing protein
MDIYERIFEASPDALLVVDARGKIVRGNSQAERMFGLPQQELAGRSVETLLPERQRDRHARLRAEFMATPHNRPMGLGLELAGRRADGVEFPVEIDLTTLETDEGLFIACALRDVSERQHARSALQASEERYRGLVESASDGILVADVQGHLLEANPAACELLGYECGELLALRWPNVVAEEESQRLAAELARLRKGPPVRSEWRFRRKDGSSFPGEINARLLPDGTLLGILRDITEHRRALKVLSASEEVLRQFIRHAPAAIAMLDHDLRYLQVSERWIRDYRLTGQEIIGRLHYEVFPEIPQRWKEIHQRVLAGSVERCEEDMFVRRDGVVDWLQWEARPWRRPDGSVGGAVFFTQSITDRKRAEAALRESEERFRGAFDFAAVGMALVAPDGRWLRVNQSMCRIVGFSETELLATDFQSITHPEDLHADLEFVQRMLSGAIDTFHMEKRYLHKDRRVVPVLLSVSLVRDAESRPIYFISQIQDITERKEIERQLTSAARSREEILALLDTLQSEAPVGIGFLSPDLRFVRCNDALAEMNGMSAAEHVGKSVPEIVPELWPQLAPLYSRVLSGAGPVVNYELMGETAARRGERRYWLGNFYPVAVGDEILGVGLVVTEITDRKRAEQELAASETRLRQIVEGMPVLMDAVDDHGLIVAWNSECERVTGYSASEIVMNPNAWNLLYPDQDYQRDMLAAWQGRKNDYRDWKWVVTCKDGQQSSAHPRLERVGHRRGCHGTVEAGRTAPSIPEAAGHRTTRRRGGA